MARIARQRERTTLEDSFHSAAHGQPQLVVINGRRQVGKTTLVQEFLSELPREVLRVSFVATEQPDEQTQLELLAAAANDAGVQLAVSTWRRMLDQLIDRAAGRPLVLAIDEAPYLERASAGWATVVQAWWDGVRHGSVPILTILTGSSVATMRQWTGASGPLFQRAEHVVAMRPFTLPQAHELLGGEPTATIEAMAACGGFPGYLSRWDPRRTADDNLLHLAFDAYAPLNFGGMRQMADAPSGGGYHSVLRAIGRGRTRHGEIAQAAGQRVDSLLEVLELAGFIRRVVPVTEHTWSKQSRYEFAEPFSRFWFNFIYPDSQLIEAGQGRAIWSRLREEWNKHLGWVFEDEARHHAIRLSDAGFWGEPLLIGRYWSNRRDPVEIDVCGLRGQSTALVGEAKWSTQPVGLRQLEQLRTRSLRSPSPVDRPALAYWTRGMATGDVRWSADLRVFGPTDMVAHPNETIDRY